jgi:hypothetical protein
MFLEHHRRPRAARPIDANVDLPGVRRDELRDDAEQRGLAAAARTDETEELAGLDREIDPIERGQATVAARVRDGEIADRDLGQLCTWGMRDASPIPPALRGPASPSRTAIAFNELS